MAGRGEVRMPRALRALRTLAIAVGMVLIIPIAALAHARLKLTSPAAGAHLSAMPAELRLDFSETPALAFSTLRLVGPDGRDVPLGAVGYAADSHRALVARVAGSAAAGTYQVQWQSAGDDGHPVRGSFEFVVEGAPTMAHHDPVSMPTGGSFDVESPLFVLVRWMEFVSLLLAVGTVVFREFVLRRALPGAFADIDARAVRVGVFAIAGLGASLVLRLLAQSLAMHGSSGALDPALMSSMITSTMWGHGWVVQLAGVAVALVGFRRSRAMAALGVVTCAMSLSLSSHAASVPSWRAATMLADGMHVLAASAWLGTLCVMLISALPLPRFVTRAANGEQVRALVASFSPVALVSAGVASVTGVVAALQHVGSVPNLWGTRYGVVLLVKLAVLSVVTMTGFYNWRFVQPVLPATAGVERLRHSAHVEAFVALVVLLVTAVLVALPTSMDAIR